MQEAHDKAEKEAQERKKAPLRGGRKRKGCGMVFGLEVGLVGPLVGWVGIGLVGLGWVVRLGLGWVI